MPCAGLVQGEPQTRSEAAETRSLRARIDRTRRRPRGFWGTSARSLHQITDRRLVHPPPGLLRDIFDSCAAVTHDFYGRKNLFSSYAEQFSHNWCKQVCKF